MADAKKDLSAFRIPLSQHLYSGFLHRTRRFWRWLGGVESAVLRDRIEAVPIDRPIYISGLARAGSTILLEIVASHPDVVTHRYRDFWSLYTPCWSEQAGRWSRGGRHQPVERSHGDGILVTPDSPEAIEEMLWMEFFPGLHDPTSSNVLGPKARNARFDRYYSDHVRKLLLARGGSRYASKANYQVTRLEYLLELFPDARFVLPVRRPREHVASLRKQHALLVDAAREHPRSVAYLDRVGHFEFGKHRIPINAGDHQVVGEILELWESGCEVRGWARYWAHVYGYLADRLERNPKLRDAVITVRHEDLCGDAENVLGRLFEHCGLADAAPIIQERAATLHRPTYYRPQFSDDQEQAIDEETSSVARQFGYDEAGTVDAGVEAAQSVADGCG